MQTDEDIKAMDAVMAKEKEATPTDEDGESEDTY